MRRWFVLGTVAVVLLAVAPAADAKGVQLPVGEADGVRIVRDQRGAIVVVFEPSAAGLWRRVAGKRVSVKCEKGPDLDGRGFVTVEEGGTAFRAPKRGRRLRTGDLTRGMDVCEVSLEPRTVTRNGERRRYGRRLIVAIPLTQRGAVRLDERVRAHALVTLLTIAATLPRGEGADGYPTPAELVAYLPLLTGPLELSVVPLASPSNTPPVDSIGYYSDGAEHVAAVVVSASGRRLFIEGDVDQVIRTNVIEYIYGDQQVMPHG